MNQRIIKMPNMNLRNRLHNCTSPYQGKTKKVLCVCSAGLLRSPTAAIVLHQEYGHNTRAAGVDLGHALIPVDEVLLAWADEVVCMSQEQQALIRNYFIAAKREACDVIYLGIDDAYEYMQEELQKLILEKYKENTNA